MKKFKEGVYYVNAINPSFRYVADGEDFREMIADFSKLSFLRIKLDGDYVQLINIPYHGFIIVSTPSVYGRFIRLNEILEISEVENNKKLTLEEERIKQLEKEKAALELQIKNQKNLALAVKALQDSGFSRIEAMRIILTIIESSIGI